MNIFVLDNDPIEAAQLQCDKHVVKMITESAQMLCTAHRILDGDITIRDSNSGKRKVKYWVLNDKREQNYYKAVHMNHPCTVWTMKSTDNYNWHYRHFIALCDEYTYRYNKVHKCDRLFHGVLDRPPNNIRSGGLTKFALAMGSNPECIVSDVVESYRNFYQTKQDRFKMVWTKRNKPDWFKIK